MLRVRSWDFVLSSAGCKKVSCSRSKEASYQPARLASKPKENSQAAEWRKRGILFFKMSVCSKMQMPALKCAVFAFAKKGSIRPVEPDIEM